GARRHDSRSRRLPSAFSSREAGTATMGSGLMAWPIPNRQQGRDRFGGAVPMTEAEWLACTDPRPMLAFLHASRREASQFACACGRRAWHLLADLCQQQEVEVVERVADGLAAPPEWEALRAFLPAGAFEVLRAASTSGELAFLPLARMDCWAYVVPGVAASLVNRDKAEAAARAWVARRPPTMARVVAEY